LEVGSTARFGPVDKNWQQFQKGKELISINTRNMNGLFTFIPNEKYHEVQKHLSLSEIGDVPEIDKAEAFESMGIVEFYNGEIDKAALHLRKSLEFTNIARKRKPRRLGITNLLVRGIVCLCV
jgi:hypothetical protein